MMTGSLSEKGFIKTHIIIELEFGKTGLLVSYILFLSYVNNKIIERYSVNMVLQATVFFAVQGTYWLDWYEIPDKTVLLTPDISKSKSMRVFYDGKTRVLIME